MFDRSAVLGSASAVNVALGDRRFANFSGNDCLISPTALKDPAAPFDLVVTDRRTGRQIRYQMKLSDKASINAPDDARYAGGRILVRQDTLESVRAALVLGLPEQTVKRAIATGRLTDLLPGGCRVAARDYLPEKAERFYRRGWSRLGLAVALMFRPLAASQM